MDTKICCCCGFEKTLDEYHNNKSKKDGKQSACKVCKNESNKNWKKNNPTKNAESQKKYHETHRAELRLADKRYKDNKRMNDPVGYYSKTTWTSLQQRVLGGIYSSAASVQTNPQHISYHAKGIRCEMTKEEYYDFWKANTMVVLQIIHSGDIPSIDRINTAENYKLGNVQIIPLSENRKKDRIRTTDKEYIYDKEQKKIENRRRYVKTHKKGNC